MARKVKMEEIKGLYICLMKYTLQNPDSFSFKDITEDRKDLPLWKCKYNCLGDNDTLPCYRPLINYPQSSFYTKVVDNYLDITEAQPMVNNRQKREW